MRFKMILTRVFFFNYAQAQSGSFHVLWCMSFIFNNKNHKFKERQAAPGQDLSWPTGSLSVSVSVSKLGGLGIWAINARSPSCVRAVMDGGDPWMLQADNSPSRPSLNTVSPHWFILGVDLSSSQGMQRVWIPALAICHALARNQNSRSTHAHLLLDFNVVYPDFIFDRKIKHVWLTCDYLKYSH